MSDHPHDAPPPPGYVPHPLSRPFGDSAPSHCILLLPRARQDRRGRGACAGVSTPGR